MQASVQGICMPPFMAQRGSMKTTIKDYSDELDRIERVVEDEFENVDPRDRA